MSAKLLRENDRELVIEVTVPKSRDFMECEQCIQEALNDAGRIATGQCLEAFDTDGAPIIVAGSKLTAKSQKVARKYETPFGVVPVERFVYQSSQGGTLHIPLEGNARIVAGSTPRFAKIVSFKYAHNNSSVVQSDLDQTLGRTVSRCYIQDVSVAVASQLEAKNRYWDYAQCQPPPSQVRSIAIGIDGTCLLFCQEGYRQAMVGTIAFYDEAGERLHTIYVAAAPEYGKAGFLKRMDCEIQRIKRTHAEARYVGVSDGATDYLPWLKGHTTTQVLDFWHVSEYLHAAAPAMTRGKAQQEAWVEDCCHKLKHEHGAAGDILAQLKEASPKAQQGAKAAVDLQRAITYLENNLGRMNYASYRKSHLPIGSGVTEAGCKTVVKQRMCGSGMKWRETGCDTVLSLRALALSGGRWSQFWQNAAQFGFKQI